MWVHDIDPIALDLGFIQIHWYGLMYLIGFAAAWGLGSWRAKQPGSGWTEEQISDLIFWGALGVVIGGRFGYVLFYNFDQFLANPLWLFAVWEGGMSFHGGLLGVLVVLALFARRYHKTFFEIGDFVAPLVPIGLGAGRVGNFIGGELWGRAADVPWAVIFPRTGDNVARHPSQLYEAALEGLVMFAVLWWYTSKPKPRAAASGLFLLLYGLFRSFVEFFREPDAHIGYLAFGWLTEGQLLSFPMIVVGIVIIIWAYQRNVYTEPKQA
ncbi:prolipoprotein diacylglyceryl transferase [Neptunomonas phycophila]|jgi:phosphatidylglycerol:prolipoprotein diacylglycerol transferase|uniref:Phosphatidylglycerol--prolipoprotein diacylglyceryl transferase n=1 Tax=Neptunomonas phycophila TaxID=1572645 RepID=A0AAW7XJA5_9GAMM|nr:prolipoprotein diacylglyceryl transferase [Neptunomonas phycophila]MBT3145521.1 prolipoprotein diacylglyceryl transferase [Neptunomonas phycophila]MDO6453038.1 prolipoprotein diacylglyceryl transferase [Neptunomonas phycophila]MDP2524289.1 prolipoprotein diacylglyceryl transferase [Neptunomonas phycophila]